ncbi:16S rRNA (guanine(966)-N(2))-methyltransferase RsmD [Mycoplasmopsis felifaucium]|uniref:16S rRNA (guanine(966)-N(2))-methyltransferase RsmD n=1 Tax=Mycoplasmopsis felifaucium TaxID=35768 RepID=UPI002286D4FF
MVILQNLEERAMIRIISGKYRHRQIEQPDTKNTRPTMDRVREAIFSSIRFEISEKIVLDLFAGSGSIGIEALSNGAMKAVLVDNDKNAIKTIKQNISSLGINNAEVFACNSLDFLQKFTGREFDFIFLDPPYAEYDLLNQCLELIKQNKFLSKFGQIIIETDDLDKIIVPSGLVVVKQKQYGQVYILYINNII